MTLKFFNNFLFHFIFEENFIFRLLQDFFSYTGYWPNCHACGECFDNWDRILQDLKKRLDVLTERANNIEDTGISSEYDGAFEAMEKQIADVKVKLESVNITKVYDGLNLK